MKNTDSRWNTWLGRARTCCRAATAIDASSSAVHSTADALAEVAEAGDLVKVLREAEAALSAAREAVQAALKARQLTPANREAEYGLAV